ncbi:DUF2797 domain-containing protein [Streptomyces aureocirculatus]|uniref:DUF2797 domain-containing protein n=1 Tax=Streptomyces aureocirculatus TaxID=67275 RepID=UPI000689AD8D|nr:DUF2797 domain-containing protein [Streptomyces aureocirculatus]
MTWWCTGVRWRVGAGPVLGWYAPGRGERESALSAGGEIAFRVRGGRRCLGVRRGGRWTVCPTGAAVAGRATRAQCEECARVDRAHSVAADTFADDPRPYHVYVAWFGPGLVKVGITGVARGGARLLEQGAVAYTWLGRGPLMAARRTEELLRTALGVPDRIPYERKRVLRARLPGAEERAGELAGVHRQAVALGGWPESLERLACEVVDHGEVFGLAALGRSGGPGGPGAPVDQAAPGAPGGPHGFAADLGQAVEQLTDGGVVAGTLLAAAGPDLHLSVDAGGRTRGSGTRESGMWGPGTRELVIDSRLMSGWPLVGLGDAAAVDTSVAGAVTVPVREIPVVQGGLF